MHTRPPRPRRTTRWLARATASATVLAISAALAPAASAAPPTMPSTSITVTGNAAGERVIGAVPLTGGGTAIDLADPYPDAIPDGYRDPQRLWARIQIAQTSSGTVLEMYCIDFLTSIVHGHEYDQGSWAEADVPHTGYISRLMAENYPAVPSQPMGVSDDVRAAAVQSAIWYFSDGYVLAADDPIRPHTAALVTAALGAGPLSEPVIPELSITPDAQEVLHDELAGPYTITGSVDAPTVSSSGASMYADADATAPIADGAVVENGTSIWLRATADGTGATLTAVGSVTMPGGSTFLYAHRQAEADGQRLIAARDADLVATAQATATFVPFGALTVTKTITGDGAGWQDDVVLHVTSDHGLDERVTIPAGAAAGAHRRTFDRLPVGSVVTVTETSTGANAFVTVSGSEPQTATIVADDIVTAAMTNTYTRILGAVDIVKSISGEGAGAQDDIVIDVLADDVPLQTITIPAGTTTQTTTSITDLPVGTVVSAVERVSGANAVVTVEASGTEPIVVRGDERARMDIENVYTFTSPPPVPGDDGRASAPLAASGGDGAGLAMLLLGAAVLLCAGAATRLVARR